MDFINLSFNFKNVFYTFVIPNHLDVDSTAISLFLTNTTFTYSEMAEVSVTPIKFSFACCRWNK